MQLATRLCAAHSLVRGGEPVRCYHTVSVMKSRGLASGTSSDATWPASVKVPAIESVPRRRPEGASPRRHVAVGLTAGRALIAGLVEVAST